MEYVPILSDQRTVGFYALIFVAPIDPPNLYFKPVKAWWLIGSSELCRLFAFAGGIRAAFWANCDYIVLSENEKSARKLLSIIRKATYRRPCLHIYNMCNLHIFNS